MLQPSSGNTLHLRQWHLQALLHDLHKNWFSLQSVIHLSLTCRTLNLLLNCWISTVKLQTCLPKITIVDQTSSTELAECWLAEHILGSQCKGLL